MIVLESGQILLRNYINSWMISIKFILQSSLLHSSPFYCGLKDEHDCWCHRTKSIPFLDTKLYIEDGKITKDPYRKPTDRCMYLLPSSCHPPTNKTQVFNKISMMENWLIIRVINSRTLLVLYSW